MKSRLRWALILVGLLGLAWIGLGRSGRNAASGEAGRPIAAQPASQPAMPSLWSLYLPTSDRPAEPDAAPARVEAPWTLRALRMRDDWCGFGMSELRRQMAQAAGAEAAPDADAERVQAWATAAVHARWQAALRQRGDPRSLALADYLSPGGEARLQALARSSTDPMVTVLALAKPCEAGACRNIEVSQWSRLEPENLLAWMALRRQAGGAAQEGYLLERMAAVGRYARSYEREAGEMLLSLSLLDGPGLMQQTEAVLLPGLLAAWTVPYAPLTRPCLEGAGQPQVAARCEAVAQTLWADGTALERSLALSVVRSVVPRSSPQWPAWEHRAREAEAVRQHEDGRMGRFLEAITGDANILGTCEAGVVLQRWMRASAGRSDWDRAQAELKAQGADLEALSRQWREKNGRSMLDLLPPRAAASRPAP